MRKDKQSVWYVSREGRGYGITEYAVYVFGLRSYIIKASSVNLVCVLFWPLVYMGRGLVMICISESICIELNNSHLLQNKLNYTERLQVELEYHTKDNIYFLLLLKKRTYSIEQIYICKIILN
jgi:hypothetical protein